MSQNSEDKVYNSWSRTPGKQPVSYNQPNKHISSGSDSSGIGRTPNWNSSESEARYSMFDGNSPWSSGSTSEFPKKMSWDESSNLRNQNNSMTFGFSSQWQTTTTETSVTKTPNWTGEPIQYEQIWAGNQPVVDAMNCSNIWSTKRDSQEIDRNFPMRAFNDSISEFNEIAQDKSVESVSTEPKTWAQAAGSVPPSECGADESKQIEIINRIEGWSNQNVDQSTPWEIEEGDVTNAEDTQQKIATESNVWTNEAPNGVGIWESHYENVSGGERGCRRWKQKSAGWDMMSSQESEEGSLWNRGASKKLQTWSCMSGMNKTGQQQQPPQAPIGSGIRSNSNNNSIYPPVQGRQHPNTTIGNMPANNVPNEVTETMNRSMFLNRTQTAISNQRIPTNTPKLAPLGPSLCSDNNQMSLFNNSQDLNRSIPNQPSHLLNLRSDWNMIGNNGGNNSSDANRASTNPVLDSSNIDVSSFRQPPVAATMNFATNIPQQPQAPPQIPPSSATHTMSLNPHGSMKPIHPMIQQSQQNHIQHIAPRQHSIIEQNPIYFDKQIMSEMQHLEKKKRELTSRMNSLYNVPGSQAIIEEVSRTLNEVNQQINAKEQTIKIRSQMAMPPSGCNNSLPNGMMNNNNIHNQFMPINNQRNVPHLQSQSQNAITDLSVQISDIKLQRNYNDLWSQGNMSSNPNNAISSPFYGMDKSNLFYNSNSGNNGNMGPTQPNLTNFPLQSRPINNANGVGSSQNNYLLAQRQMNAPNPIHQQLYQQQQHQQHSRMVTPTNWQTCNNSFTHSSSSSNNNMLNSSSVVDSNLTENNCDNNSNISGANTSDIANISAANSNALSLPHNLSSNNTVSSAFNSRDVSHLSANINEFVPGQPWPGASYSQKDDTNMTLGNGTKSFLSIKNDHLEHLASSGVNNFMNDKNTGANLNGSNRNSITSLSMNAGHGSGGAAQTLPAPIVNNSSFANNYLPQSGVNGIIHRQQNHNQKTSTTTPGTLKNYILIRNLQPHINVDMLRKGINAQKFPGFIQMQPNMMTRCVLLQFQSNEEAAKAYNSLPGNVGIIELMSEFEISQLSNSY